LCYWGFSAIAGHIEAAELARGSSPKRKRCPFIPDIAFCSAFNTLATFVHLPHCCYSLCFRCWKIEAPREFGPFPRRGERSPSPMQPHRSCSPLHTPPLPRLKSPFTALCLFATRNFKNAKCLERDFSLDLIPRLTCGV